MIQGASTGGYVIASGKQYAVREVVSWTAKAIGITIKFEGSGVDEGGIVANIDPSVELAVSVGDVLVRVEPRYFRPSEVETLLGDATRAAKELNWIPEISAEDMCREMVREDIKLARQARLLNTQE